ncbi:MAG: methionine ABC transporter ATP-binding protein [Propionibacteriaceae bacterium]|jgi:D-methionine transport system ATP-binding protein|nr:methionine ABC transporter ATP-binding protein [Propionibacteriaceae bacterium]
MTAEPLISFAHASKTFVTKDKTVRAVNDVSLEIPAREIFGVIGHSGAGKSTLVRLVNALETVDSGTVRVNGTDLGGLGEKQLRRLRADIGMVFQQFALFSAKTVAENVGYPLKLAGWPKARRAARIAEMLDFVGLADKAGAYPSHLSGGQKQRVGIARALAHSPQILLADEATSALDPETTGDVLGLLQRANRELGTTIVVITHEMGVVQNICHRVAVMEAGMIVETGPTYDVFARPAHPTTRRFIQNALHSHPAKPVTDRLHAAHPGRLVLMTVTAGSLDSEAFNLARIAAGRHVVSSIVYGSITEVAGRPLGNVVVEMVSDLPDPAAGQTAIDDLLAQLAADGIGLADLGTAAAPLDDPAWAELSGEETTL